MARYNDISHFRAPYKDSVLQGFGAYTPVSYAVELDSAKLRHISRKDVPNNAQALLKALDTSFAGGPPVKKTAKLDSNNAYVTEILPASDVAAKNLPPGITEVTPFSDIVKSMHDRGFALLVPSSLDLTKSWSDNSGPRIKAAFLRPGQGLKDWARADSEYAILVPAKSLFTVANIAGAAAIGLVAVALLGRKRR